MGPPAKPCSPQPHTMFCASVSPFAPLTLRVLMLPHRTLFHLLLPPGSISPGKKPPDCPSNTSLGLPSTHGTLSQAAYPSIVLSAGGWCSLGPGDAGAASAALLWRWIEEVKRQLENFGSCLGSYRVGEKEETGRGDAAAAPSQLHVMLWGRAESALAQGPADLDPVPGTSSCPSTPPWGHLPCPRVVPQGHLPAP